MTKPTRARVNKMIKCSHFAFERDDIRLEWVDVLKAYLAQEEELKEVNDRRMELIAMIEQLKAENQALKEELKEIQRFVIHEHDGGPYD